MIDNRLAAITKRFQRAKTQRQLWESTFDEVYEFTQPGRPRFYTDTPGNPRLERVFDSAPIHFTQEFANRMQSGIAPRGSRWATLRPGPKVPKEQQNQIKAELDEATNVLFEAIANSNFATELNECLLDMSVGTGVMHVDDGKLEAQIVCNTIPLPMVYLDKGPSDRVDAVFRTRKMRPNLIKTVWPKATVPADMLRPEKVDQEIEIVDVVYRDWEDLARESYHYCVFSPQMQMIFLTDKLEGRGSNPFLTARWSKASGEIYGRGPAFNALPDIKTLNLTMQLILENAELAISGVWQAEDDGVLNPDTIRLVPGAIIPRALNSRGLEPLQAPGRFDVSQLILENMRTNVRKALFAESLGPPEGTPMSATEVAERAADLARMIGAPLTRVWDELLVPFLNRTIYILNKRGELTMPTLDGKKITAIAESPLARASRNEDITQFMNFATIMGQLFGPEAVARNIEEPDVAAWLAAQYSVPREILISKAKQLQRAKEAGQMQQMQSAMGGMQPGLMP